jgi:DNA invertase Pin-like site-specific DNA recombinase
MKSLSRMTAEDLKAIVEEAVEKKLYEIVQDPDSGLKLRPEVRKRLRRTLTAERKGARGIPAFQVAKKLGLRW